MKKRKKLKIGDRIATLTPKYTYSSIIYKVKKAIFHGYKHKTIIIDEAKDFEL